MKSRSSGEASARARSINWAHVLLLVCVGYMVLFGILEFHQRSREASILESGQEVSGRRPIGSQEEGSASMTPLAGREFQYPVAEEVGAPIPFDPVHSAYPAVPENERLRLQELVQRNQGEIPPDISLE